MSSITDINKVDKDNRSLFVKVMSFLADNVFSFTVSVMGLVHVVLFFFMLASGVEHLVIFNVFSVILYIFCLFLCRKKIILPVYVGIILEVTAYTILSSYYIGIDKGTHCFLFAIIPIIIYFGSSLFKRGSRWGIAIILLLNFTTFAVLYGLFYSEQPPYTVTPGIKLALTMFAVFVMVFSTIFYSVLYIFLTENLVDMLEKKNELLSVAAREDALTSLLNRRGFLPIVADMMRNDDEPFCIAFCDLDDFKHVNDSYGHDGGDEVLKNVTLMIREELPGCDICRWGGEEFVILMKGYDLAGARLKAEALRTRIGSQPTVFYGKHIYVTTTIGLEEKSDRYSDPEAIIKVADERMYYGKQHGKNILICEDV